MGMQFLMKALARYTGGADAEQAPGIDSQKNLLVAQGNPAYAEIRRRGEGWTVATATAFAALVDVPTTTARAEFYNNTTNRVAVVSDLHCFRLLGTAVIVGEGIWAMISTAKAVPSLTALTLFSLSGKAFVVPTATSDLVTGVGTTVVANGWTPYGGMLAYLAAATPGASWSVPIDGKLQIPPGCSLCLQVVASINTAAAFNSLGMTFDWVTMAHEA